MRRDSYPIHDHLREILEDTRYGILTTRRVDGSLHSRLLTRDTICVDAEGRLLLCIARKGEALADLENDPAVCLVCSRPEKDQQISMCGTARVIEDPILTRQWPVVADDRSLRPPDEGADADRVRLRFSVLRADCWDFRCKLLQSWLIEDAAQMAWLPERNTSRIGTSGRAPVCR